MITIIIAIGYLITKKGIFSAKARADMTDVVVYVVLPCNIFASFGVNISPEVLRQSFVVLLVSFGMQLLYVVLNKVLYRHMHPQRRVVAQYATICNNSGFMGLPVIEAVFGSTGLLYGSVVLIPLRVFMWTAGLSLFTSIETKQKIKALMLHPCILAVVLGIAQFFAPFELPGFITDTIKTIGGCTTALTMLIVGSILSEVEPKGIFDKDCFYYSLIRLIVIPAIVLGALLILKLDPLVIGVCVLSCAMPAATVSAMMAEKYGQDFVFASKMLLVSTVLSVLTLPLVAEILTGL